MDKQAQIKPNYKTIYTDILSKKYPEKKDKCIHLLDKKNLSALDIINLNVQIFGARTSKTHNNSNQRYRSYGKSDILKILDYQKKYRINNSQLANHFKISRNTIAKWRKMFLT